MFKVNIKNTRTTSGVRTGDLTRESGPKFTILTDHDTSPTDYN